MAGKPPCAPQACSSEERYRTVLLLVGAGIPDCAVVLANAGDGVPHSRGRN